MFLWLFNFSKSSRRMPIVCFWHHIYRWFTRCAARSHSLASSRKFFGRNEYVNVHGTSVVRILFQQFSRRSNTKTFSLGFSSEIIPFIIFLVTPDSKSMRSPNFCEKVNYKPSFKNSYDLSALISQLTILSILCI